MDNFEKVKKILQIIKYLFFFGLSIFVMTALALIFDGLSNNVQKSDAIVILGNKVELNGVPSARLASRLDKGVELYNNQIAPTIIVTGGTGVEGFDEAKTMKQYLVDKGIPAESILVDSQGINTFESAKNIQKIVQEKNLTSVLVVSNYYHISRTVFIFEKNTVPKVYSAHANFFELRDLYSIPREVIGFYYYMFR